MDSTRGVLNPFQALCFADQYIMECNWYDALACLFSVLVYVPPPSARVSPPPSPEVPFCPPRPLAAGDKEGAAATPPAAGAGGSSGPSEGENVEPPAPPGVQRHLLKRAARLYAEINGALPNGDPHKQEAAAVQLLVLSHVKANEWLGTQGVAATMLHVESTRIGDVVMNYDTRMPMLILGDDYCAACQTPHAKGRCSQCHLAYYCCPEHQREDWKLHKIQCATSRSRGSPFWNSTEPYRERLAQVRQSIAKSLETK